MSRIAIDALPTIDTLTDEQLAELFGRGLSKTTLGLTNLEGREMMSVTSVFYSGSVLAVATNNANTAVKFDTLNANTVRISEVGTSNFWDRSVVGINRLQFVGGSGNDSATNNTAIRLNAWGNAGNDVLIGSNVATDQLIGGDGNDRLIGRGGADVMYGDAGDDTIVAIDSYTDDYVNVGTGNDTVWRDRNGSSLDTVVGTGVGDKVHDVGGFANAGADRTLNGDSITDPTVKAGQTTMVFANRPLFSTSGPQMTDIRQGNYGDCWLLAGLSAIANDSPNVLKQNIVDFGDGTYGVKLGSSFYRVDNSLPVWNNTSNLSAAALGAQSSMWVAIAEKAYAHYRTGANSYASIEGGWSKEVNAAFGSASAGGTNLTSYANATALANDIYNRWNGYQSVTVGFLGVKPGYGSANPIVTGHMYTVASVQRNSSGVVTSITLRNPWGVDGGGNVDSNTQDGFVTVTPATLFKYTGQVNYGKV